jgi:hypothetical protein
MARTEKYFIGPALLSDIRRVVGRVDNEPIPSTISRIPTRLQDVPRAASKVFRICTFTGSWSKSASKVVTFKFQTTTPNTVSASNLFATVSGSTVTSTNINCAIAREGTAWFLIAAECGT